MGVEVVAVNILELAVSPGLEVLAAVGGLARFTGWRGALVAVSHGDRTHPAPATAGGFRARRLPVVLRDDGDRLSVRSEIDGSVHDLSHEALAAAAAELGATLPAALLPPATELRRWPSMSAPQPPDGWIYSAVPDEAARLGLYLAPGGWAEISQTTDAATPGALVPGCECRACQVAGAGYIAHLWSQREITATHLLGWHNLHAIRAQVEA